MTADTDNLAHIARSFQNSNIDQIAFLVEDLKTSIELWDALLGTNEWQIFTYTPNNVEDLSYRDQPADFSMRLALTNSHPQLELIQPLSGRSIYNEWIDAHGYGLHHLGFFVESVDETVARLQETGVNIIQSGRNYGMDGDGGFAYFESPTGVECVFEAIEPPARRRPSETL